MLIALGLPSVPGLLKATASLYDACLIQNLMVIVTRIVRLSSGSGRFVVSRFSESTKINSAAKENDDP